MAGGQQPGSNSRGRGGKFRKFTRGGGKHFSRDLRPLDADGNEINMWSADSNKKGDDESSEEDSEEDSEEESEDGDDAKPQAEMTRAERKAAAKARKDAAVAKKRAQAVEVGDLPPSDSEESSEDDADMPANPNHSKAARNQTKAPVAAPEVDEAAEGVKKLTVANNRKERESMEAAQAKERYRKLHEAGKTDEAKADLARLRLIREQRAADAARREAEREEREAQEATKRQEIEAKEAKKREAALGPAKKGKKSSK